MHVQLHYPNANNVHLSEKMNESREIDTRLVQAARMLIQTADIHDEVPQYPYQQMAYPKWH